MQLPFSVQPFLSRLSRKIEHITHQLWFDLAVMTIGVVAIVLGLLEWWWLANDGSAVSTTSTSVPAINPSLGQITVDVSGAVLKPGLYQLHTGDRIGHAVELAGGFDPTVDLSQVHQALNLAAAVTDGQKIYIPVQVAETAALDSEQLLSSPVQPNSTAISLNQATADELQTLPGIGEKKAADIITARPFTAIDELVTKQIVTEKVWQQIKNIIKL